jgi:LPPG:FO 2-phospho-L-lactate transferase
VTSASIESLDGIRIVALSGGVGGAKLSLGLSRLLGGRLTVVVNTGDDFEHLGLHVSPDIDTALYTLADVVNPETGWGRRDETWTFMEATKALGGPKWFQLGDGDLATHVLRTQRLRDGATLTDVTAELAGRFGLASRIVPMSDAAVRTIIDTEAGRLEFQHYFVREQCRPRVKAIAFEGAAAAAPSPAALEALADPALAGIIICPSNPYLSVDPLLAIPDLRRAIAVARAPVLAVSPIVGGAAIKGPTAKIMGELGIVADAAAVARHYGDLIDGYVLDQRDESLRENFKIPVLVAQTVMRTLEDKMGLARVCIDFCAALATGRTS